MQQQRYVSDELTHFVGRSYNRQPDAEDLQFNLLVSILKSGYLGTDAEVKVSRESQQSFSGNQFYRANVVCFSDIPVADLGIHMKKFSRFGLAFKKSFLIARGANPVFYVARNALARLAGGRTLPRAEYFDQEHAAIMALFGRLQEEAHQNGLSEESAKIRELLGFLVFHFFSFAKFFDQGLPADHEENFYMEREWRIMGSLDFALGEVSRVIFPQRFARHFRDDLPQYYGQITFS